MYVWSVVVRLRESSTWKIIK